MKTRLQRTVRPGMALVLAAMLLVPANARSQESSQATPIAVGTRVRILAPTVTGVRIEGMVIETNESSLLIGINDRVPLRVSRQAITQLEVSMGQRRQVKRGMILGAAIGVAVFALAGASYHGDKATGSSDWAQLLGTGAAGGALWGAGIGALVKSERWTPVPAERVRLSLGPTRGHGVGLSLSVGF